MTTVGPYRLESPVGEGAACTVWRAVRPGPVPRAVAIKRAPAGSDPGGRDRLRREAEVLTALDHPHVVPVLDVLDDGDGVAIVMRLARGGSLHDLLAERGRLTAGETVAVLAPVADALGSAHRSGVLHGDVKPANILFTGDGEPLLGDFGVAQHLRSAAAGGGLRAVEGTAGYVDPELVATGRPEPRNDVYGVAVVAYRCLTGRLPHDGDSAREILTAAEVDDHPPLSGDPSVPRALAEVVEAALARDPRRRPATAAALARALRGALPPSAPVLPGPARVAALRVVAEADRAGLPGPTTGDGAVLVPGRGDDRRRGERRRVGDRRGGGDADPSDRRGAASGPVGGTRAFGPPPPATGSSSRPPRRLRAGVLVAAALVAVVPLAVVGRVGWSGSAEQPVAGTNPSAEPRRDPAGECPAWGRTVAPAGSEVLEADVLGTGCPLPLVWDGRILSVRLDPDDAEPRRYELVPRRGGAGQLVVGDWDCDGSHTPGYYQPATGVVSYFGAVPVRVGEEMSARTRDSGVLAGRATVVVGADGCDTVEVARWA